MELSKITFLSIIILFIGCSPNDKNNLSERINFVENLTVYAANAQPPYQLKFKEEQTFGGTNEINIGELKSVAVDDIGRVYLADANQRNIKVYKEDGNFLSLLGKEGRGPGEFNEITNIEIIENRLFAYDHNQQRAIVFSLDSLSYDFTINLAENREEWAELGDAYLSKPYVRRDGTFLVEFIKPNMSKTKNDWELIENNGLYYFLDEKGQIASEKLFEKKSSIQVLVPLPGRRVGMPISVYGKSMVSFSNENLIYTAWSTDFLIKIYGPDGEYERAFYYPIDEVPLTAESISKVGSQLLQKGMSSMDLPESWPVLNALIVDDENRLWVSTTVENHEVYEWWVLEKSGELMAKFEWPRYEPIEEVRNGYMYTRETVEETGLQQIVRYSFEMD